MILQALTRLHAVLFEQKKISPIGWDDWYNVSFALDLNDDGTLFDITDKRHETPVKKSSNLSQQQ